MRTLVLDRTSWLTHPDMARGVIQEVWGRVFDLSDQYPQFSQWFDHKVIPGLQLGERILLVEFRNNAIAGLAILKDTPQEQKLCCLRVMDDFVSTGLGIRLFERSFELLGNEKPLLSISDARLPSFARVCNYFGFQLEQELTGFYRPGRTEYVFNGLLRENRQGESHLTRRSFDTFLNSRPPAF